MKSLPLTPNGKIDRRALPSPFDLNMTSAQEYVAPSTTLECALTDIWKEVLQVERVGISQNFFDLGGHSLLMAQVHGKLSSVLGRDIPIRYLFEHSTIGSLAEYLSQESQAQPSLQNHERTLELTAGKDRLKERFRRRQGINNRGSADE
jgi:acyl carrier protein